MEATAGRLKVSRNASDEHEFYTLGQKPFEHFVRALHEVQPEIIATHLYGPDGQTQFGADHVAYHRTETATYLEVGQSKAYRRFGRTQIAAAAKAFLDHWETNWRDKDVRRFILFVGCAIKSRQAHDEVIAQTRIFAALGVAFNVWDANGIYDRLSSAPAVVRTYLGQEWYEKLFGEPSGPLMGLVRDLQSGDFGAIRVASYVARLNQAESAEVLELRRRARRGEIAQVVAHLERALFQSPAAAATTPEVRAQMLRLLAGLLIRDRVFVRIKQYLDEADALEGESSRLRALLLLESVGADALLADTADSSERTIREVRAVAQLRLQRPECALEELQPELVSSEPSAETLRLAAIAKLLTGDREAALLLAERSVLRDPESRACQQMVAICLFHRALSPSVEPSTGEWPQPVDQPMVRISDAARGDLERAEELFAGLMADPSLADHQSMVMWHFGVLACMPWRRTDAERRIVELQVAGSLPIPLIAWCIARGLPFDAAAARAQCDMQLARDRADFESLLIRIALANFERDHAGARALLENGRAALEANGHDDLYRYWSAVLDLEAHRTPTVHALESHPWLRLRLALDIRARKKRLKSIEAVLEAELASAGDARVITASTQLLLEGGWHKTAAKAASYLVEQVGTGEAIGLAAHALYRVGQVSDVLKALENRDAFPGGRLPIDLERLRAEALAISGEIVSARDTSLAVARSTGSARDILRSIEFHLAMGAAPAALALYEEHASVLTAPTTTHVLLARAVLHFDPDAAARITRQLAEETPDALVTAAFELASRLRLDTEQRTLIGRIQALGAAGAAGVEMVSVDDIIERMKRHHAQVEQAFEQYANGHAPVHLIVGFRNAAFPLLYLGPLLSPPRPEIRTSILSARYGRRFDADDWPVERGDVRLLADLTALLTAHGLEILDVVERAFAPVWIAPDTINAILALRNDIGVAQPDRITAARRVCVLCDSGALRDAQQVSQIDTFSVMWDRTSGEPAATLNFSRFFELIASEMPRSEKAMARSALGNALDTKPSGAKPPAHATLNLEIGIAETLEHAGLLDIAMERFQLTVTTEDSVRMRATVNEADERDRLAASLGTLLKRLSDGLEDGTYKSLPAPPSKDNDVLRRAFMQILEAMTDGGGLAWVDDRFTSSIDTRPFRIVTSVELIDALRRYDRLTTDAAHQLRQRLRQARWQFMPLEGDEIVHFVRAATRGGALSETKDLVTIRRAMGEMLLHRRRLQWPEPQAAEKGARGEVPYLLDAGHAITHALAAIWNDPNWTIEDATAASTWLYDYLEVGLFPLPILGAGDPRSDHLIGIHLGGLILTALQVLPGKWREMRQAAFLAWIWDHVSASLKIRPGFREPMVDMVEKHLVRTLDDEPEDPTWLALAGNMLNSMPASMRAFFLDRPAIRTAFNLPEHHLVTVADYDFDELEFWDALAAVDAATSIKIKATSGEMATLTQLTDQTHSAIELRIGRRGFRLDDWPNRIAQNDPAVRRVALEERAQTFDLSCEALDTLNLELGGKAKPSGRVQLAMRRAQSSMQQWYADLGSSIEQRKSFRISELTPDDIRKVTHLLRLQEDLNVGAHQLVRERGLAVAVRRFGGLPITPPDALADAVSLLSDEELSAFLEEVEGDTAPPWTQLFLASLVLQRDRVPTDAAARLRVWVESALSDRADQQWQLYITLAQFTCGEGPAVTGWQELNAIQQLSSCWLHASATAEVILSGHVLIDKLIEVIEEHRLVSPRLLIEVPHKFTGDRADPRQANHARSRTFGAAPSLFAWAEEEDRAEWAEQLIREQILETGDEGARLRLEIAHGGLMQNDLLGSIFAVDWSHKAEALHPGAGALFGAGLEALVKALLELEPDSHQAGAGWTFLRAASGDAPLPPPMAALAIEAGRRTDLTNIDKGLTETRHTLLAFEVIAAVNGWIDQRDRIDTAAKTLWTEPTSDDDTMLRFEIAVWRARMEPDLLERTRVMGRELLRLGQYPQLREKAESAARYFARGLSGQHTEAFVDTLAEIYASH